MTGDGDDGALPAEAEDRPGEHPRTARSPGGVLANTVLARSGVAESTVADSGVTAPAQRSARRPLPGLLLVVVGYLIGEGVVRCGAAVAFLLGDGDQTLGPLGLWSLLIGSFYLVLVPQLLFRSRVARHSLAVILVLQIALIIQGAAVDPTPEWWSEGVPSRLQTLGRLMLHTAILIILYRGRVARALRL